MKRRSQAGAKLQVHLSRDESADWADEAFRAKLQASLAKMAAARGRRFYEVFSCHGASLVMAEV